MQSPSENPLLAIAEAIQEAQAAGIEKTQYQLRAAMPAISVALDLGYKHTQIHQCLEAQGIEWTLNYYRVLFNRAKAMKAISVPTPNHLPPSTPSIASSTNAPSAHPDTAVDNDLEDASTARVLVLDELAKARAAGNIDYTRNKRRGPSK